ncbi:MAG TPA: hypothetical protein VN181_10770, partial [Thermoanaerobaculia bacterium]|nr:hypothetical protein [Thermoanaerobaculia bacterium]
TTSFTALMNSTVDFDRDATGATLQNWDRDAVAAVYGSGTTCTPPAIATQPQPVSIATPQRLTLSVAASSEAQATFQWFIGQSGVTSSPIAGSNVSAIAVEPQVTTSYWVRVSNGCAPDAISDTATVTVAGCPAVFIRSTSADTTIIEGKSTILSVDAVGGTLSYQWFEGETPIGNTPQVEVRPTRLTQYRVRVTNQCGAASESAPITISVLPCVAARIVVEPVGGDAVLGDPIAIYAGVIGTQPLSMQWYEGAAPDRTRAVTNGSVTSITTNPILVPSSYWLQVTNDCGSDDSVTARVNVVASCIAPQLTLQPASTNVAPGATSFLTAGVTGTSLTYRWYQGPVFDFTKPVDGNNPTLLTPAITTPTQFWLHVTNSCGTVSTSAVTVTPVNPRRRIAK